MATHGTNSHFTWDAVDLTTDMTNIDVPESIDTAETTTLTGAAGGAKKSHIPGNEDGTISIDLIWTPALETSLRAKKQTIGAFVYGPEGSVAADRRVTGNAFLTGITTTSDVNDAVKMSATFQVTGGFTADVFP